MILSDGLPPTKEKATKFREIMGKWGWKKVARCKSCGNNCKNLEHMAYFELRSFWDFNQNRKNRQYVGICLACVEKYDKELPKTESNGIVSEKT